MIEPAADLAAAQRAWRADGCVLLRGALSPGAVDNARSDMVARLAAQAVDAADARGVAASAIDAFALHRDDPGFARIAASAELRQAIEAVVGFDVHLYPSVQIRFALPDDDVHTIPMHQDARYINPDLAFGAFWIALADIPLGHGGLAVVPGSHRDGLHEHRLSYDYYSYYMGEERPQRCIDLDAIGGEWATAEFEAGDVLLFDSFIVHTALPNRSPRIRLSIDGRFQDATRPRINWQSRYTVLEGTVRRAQVIALLHGADELEPNLREAVIARMLVDELPIDAATVARVLREEAAAR